MKRHPSSPTRSQPQKIWARPMFILALAGIGQAFLSQWEKPYTLYPGLIFYTLAAYLFLKAIPGIPEAEKQTLRREGLWLFLILALAAFFRFYHLEDIPPGLWIDSSTDGLGGLKVLHENWRPFFEEFYSSLPAYVFYLAALWFKWLDPTLPALRTFFVLLALAAFPLIYWTFRQLSGPRTALMALFILAVMRCDASYSHLGYPVNHVAFFIFGTLAFWLHGVTTRKAWAFALAGAFFAGGFYTYHGYKIFALAMAACFFYEILRDRSFLRKNIRGLAWGTLAFLVLAGPFLAHILAARSIGEREMEVLILPSLWAEKTIWPLLRNILEVALVFNRKGDLISCANFKSHRLLDDVTGVFFFLGLALALWKFRERPAFYALAGLFVMSLNGILTFDPTFLRRILSDTPFIALLAALAARALWKNMSWPFKPGAAWMIGLLGLLMAGQNYHQYFVLLAQDPVFQQDSDPAPTDLGQRIVREGANYDFCLSPRYDGHRTVKFLAYFHQKDFYRMDWPSDLVWARVTPGKKGVCFALEKGKFGVVRLLRSLYPQARIETLKDSMGENLNTYIYVPREQLEALRQKTASWKKILDHGLRAEYFHLSSGQKVLVGTRQDPLINFTCKSDMAFVQDPMEVTWQGTLLVPRTGRYDLLVLTETNDRAVLELDGKTIAQGGSSPSGQALLTKGPHRVSLDLRMSEDWYSATGLAWKAPGQEKFEIVPNEAFGNSRNIAP